MDISINLNGDRILDYKKIIIDSRHGNTMFSNYFIQNHPTTEKILCCKISKFFFYVERKHRINYRKQPLHDDFENFHERSIDENNQNKTNKIKFVELWKHRPTHISICECGRLL